MESVVQLQVQVFEVVLSVGLSWKVAEYEPDWLLGQTSDFLEESDFVREAIEHVQDNNKVLVHFFPWLARVGKSLKKQKCFPRVGRPDPVHVSLFFVFLGLLCVSLLRPRVLDDFVHNRGVLVDEEHAALLQALCVLRKTHQINIVIHGDCFVVLDGDNVPVVGAAVVLVERSFRRGNPVERHRLQVLQALKVEHAGGDVLGFASAEGDLGG